MARMIEVKIFAERERIWKALEFLQVVQGVIAGIPKEFIGGAVAEVDCDDGIVIRYWRPETDADVAAKKVREAKYAAERERIERENYERLRAKFEPKP